MNTAYGKHIEGDPRIILRALSISLELGLLVTVSLEHRDDYPGTFSVLYIGTANNGRRSVLFNAGSFKWVPQSFFRYISVILNKSRRMRRRTWKWNEMTNTTTDKRRRFIALNTNYDSQITFNAQHYIWFITIYPSRIFCLPQFMYIRRITTTYGLYLTTCSMLINETITTRTLDLRSYRRIRKSLPAQPHHCHNKQFD